MVANNEQQAPAETPKRIAPEFTPNYDGHVNRHQDDCDEATRELLRQYHHQHRRRERRQPSVDMVQTWAKKPLGPLPVWSWLLLIALSAVIFGYNLGGARTLTEHETYLAGPAKQMVLDGDYLIPRIGEHLWIEKPPLPYWAAAAACVAAGEFSERMVRLPSTLTAIGVVLIIAGLNARWFGAQVGLLAGVTQATCVYMVSYARLAEADMLLALVVVAAIGVFDRFRAAIYEDRETAVLWWRIAFWGLIALTGLIKGLLFGAVLVAAPCLVWDAWTRRLSISWQLFSATGVAFVLLTWVAWPALVVAREPAALQMWYDHLFGRISGRIDFNVEPAWYYLTTWPWQLLPWTPLLFVAAWPSLKRAWQREDGPDRFVWCWAVVPVLLLTLSRGKHHHYLLYSLPALSTLVALGLMECGRRIVAQSHHTLELAKFYSYVLSPTALFVGGVLVYQFPEYRQEAAFFAMLIACGAAALGWTSSRRQTVAAYLSVAVPVIVAIAYVHQTLLPARDPSAADRDFLALVDEQVPPGVNPIVCGSGEVFGREIARHIFYLDREVVPVWCARNLAAIHQETYIISRRSIRGSLSELGTVHEMAVSDFSRGEQSPEDRFALLRVDPHEPNLPVVASETASQLLR